MSITELERIVWQKDGYIIRRAVFSTDEIEEMISHYMALNAEGPHPGDFAGVPTEIQNDPLATFPRLIQMHQYDEKSAAWANDPRLVHPCAELMGQSAVLNQTMLYYKPAGARGQSFHQDCLYIRLHPLIGAWVSLDRADEENGTMVMAPGSQKLGLLRGEEADTSWSFTSEQTAMPTGQPLVAAILQPGDVIFFDGFCIHGSYPNRSSDRFRRAFICHFQGANAGALGGPSQLH